jgi:hypothetical protein
MAGRRRTIEPNPHTPEGQWALYLAHLLDGKDLDQVAEAAGKNRSTLFRYLRGEFCPPIREWDALAKALNLKGWTALVPPAEFLTSLKKRK